MYDKRRSDEHAVTFVSIKPRRRTMRNKHSDRKTKSGGGPKHSDTDIRIPFFHGRKMHSAHPLEDDIDRTAAGCPDHIHDQDRECEMIHERVSESFFELGCECWLLCSARHSLSRFRIACR